LISALLFGTTTGLYTLDTVDKYINEIGIITSAIVMTAIVAFGVRKLPELQRHLNRVSTFRLGAWWRLLVGVVAPIVLLFMLISTGITLLDEGYGGYPTWMLNAAGWGAVGFAILFAIVFTILPGRRDEAAEAAFDPDAEDDLEEVR